MSPNLHIALRFLTAKRRAMIMSLSCIVLGVGLFVVTQATTSGFEQFFIRTILGTNGAIRIEDRIQDTLRSMEAAGGASGSPFQISTRDGRRFVEGIEEPALLAQAVQQFPNVSGVSAVLHGAVRVQSAYATENARAYGIELADHLRVSDLEDQIIHGDLADFRGNPETGILVGSPLAERLQIAPGDSLVLEANEERRRYRVSAIYETGVKDIDQVRLYLHLSQARSLLKRPTGASFLQVNLLDASRAPQDAWRMREVLRHGAVSWQEREKVWLEVFRALRLSTAITVSVFTLIAGLAMFNTLAMIVLEKTKEIAILRSMGYTRRDVTRIFLWQAGIVLALGTVAGWALGAGVTYAISVYPIRIRGIFATDTFVVDWSLWHYVAATVTAVTMVMLASLVPARRAARLEPGDIIRGTAQ